MVDATIPNQMQPPTLQPPASLNYSTSFFNMSTSSVGFGTNANDFPTGDPTGWNCEEVYRFVCAVAGESVANQFKTQDIDGQALNLIRNDHLVNTMQIRLGPALKIISRFDEAKTRYAAFIRQQLPNMSH